MSVLRRSKWVIFPVVLLANVAVGANAADSAAFKPFISLSEEFTSNVYEVARGMRKEAITRVQPGIDFKYAAPRWTGDAGYNLDYQYYARQSQSDKIFHNARLDGKISVIENLLFVDVRDTYQLTSIDITRNAAEESLTQGQQKTNRAFASIYLQKLLGTKLSSSTGYRYNDTRYFASAGIEKSEHSGFLDLSYALSPKLSLTASYNFGQNATTINDITRHEANGGFRYEYAEKSFLYANAGNSWQRFKPGNRTQNLTWHAGLTHDFRVLTANLETKTQTSDDSQTDSTRQVTYSGRLDKQLRRGTVSAGATYDEYFLTRTGERDRHKTAVNGSLRYELLDRFIGSINATADRTKSRSATEYPYRVSVASGLSYGFNYDISLNGTYTYVNYRYGLRDATGGKEIQRVVVELKKTF